MSQDTKDHTETMVMAVKPLLGNKWTLTLYNAAGKKLVETMQYTDKEACIAAAEYIRDHADTAHIHITGTGS